MMRHLFEGKRVALIGSSPTILEHEYGSAIDAHDVVMRINLHGIHGRPECLGSRTDVRYLGTKFPESLRPQIRQAAQCKSLIYCYHHEKWIARELGTVPSYQCTLKMRQWLERVNPELLDGMQVHQNLTSGTNAIAIVLDHNPASVTLYGFDLDPTRRMDTISEDGDIIQYQEDLVTKAHGKPEDEAKVIQLVMNHYPVVMA